jgi:RHS repeat-associated protein
VVASYHLDTWGNFRFPSELNQSKNRFAFTGHLYDRETDLLFAKARYLDPELGRFLSQDSFLGEISEPPSLHRYVYVNNRPTFLVDPTGHAGRPKGVVSDEGYYVPIPTTGEYVEVHGDPVKQLEYEVATGQRSRSSAVTTNLDLRLARPTARLATRGLGGARAVGGGIKLGLAAAFAATPEPTGLTKFAAGYFAFTGLDDIQAGGRQFFSGAPTEAVGDFFTEKTLTVAGVDPKTARFATPIVRAGVDVGVGGGAMVSRPAAGPARSIEGLSQESRISVQPQARTEPLPPQEAELSRPQQYLESSVSRRTLAYRQEQAARGEPVSLGRNVAAFEWENPTTGSTEGVVAASQGRHAERLAYERVPEYIRTADPETTGLRGASELQPCGADYHNCAAWLQRNAPDVPVEYGFAYPEGSKAARAAGNAAKKAAVREALRKANNE